MAFKEFVGPEDELFTSQMECAHIASQLNLSSSQRSMMRLLSCATGSALQARGNPNDPAAAFAQDFLGSVMSGLPMPQARPTAARDAREATLALLDETFGNTARDPRDTLLLAAGPDVGVWTESLSRSFDFGRGYAEGSGMSLLQTGEAVVNRINFPFWPSELRAGFVWRDCPAAVLDSVSDGRGRGWRGCFFLHPLGENGQDCIQRPACDGGQFIRMPLCQRRL